MTDTSKTPTREEVERFHAFLNEASRYFEKRQTNEASKSDYWSVTVSRGGEPIVTIEPKMLSGREISEQDEKAIREAALNLLGFIGDHAPASAPEPSDLAEKDYGTPIFDAVWEAIKRWDLDRGDYPGAANRRSSYAGATGTDVQAILNVVNPFVTAARAEGRREGIMDAAWELADKYLGVEDLADDILALADQETTK